MPHVAAGVGEGGGDGSTEPPQVEVVAGEGEEGGSKEVQGLGTDSRGAVRQAREEGGEGGGQARSRRMHAAWAGTRISRFESARRGVRPITRRSMYGCTPEPRLSITMVMISSVVLTTCHR